MAIKNLQQATHYCYDFLNDYYQQQEFLPREDIFFDLFDRTMELFDDVEIDDQTAQLLDEQATDELKADTIFSEKIADYPQRVQQAMAEYLANFVDIENTKIEVNK